MPRGTPTPWGTVESASVHVLPTCVEVGIILLGGVLLNELLDTAGANQDIADWIARATRQRARAIVLIVLGVTPFAESIMGFGVGVVVAVPLLIRLRVLPQRAAIAGLLGLVVVPWGALAPGTLIAAQFTGVDLGELGELSALLSVPVYLVCAAAALLIAVGWTEAEQPHRSSS